MSAQCTVVVVLPVPFSLFTLLVLLLTASSSIKNYYKKLKQSTIDCIVEHEQHLIYYKYDLFAFMNSYHKVLAKIWTRESSTWRWEYDLKGLVTLWVVNALFTFTYISQSIYVVTLNEQMLTDCYIHTIKHIIYLCLVYLPKLKHN